MLTNRDPLKLNLVWNKCQRNWAIGHVLYNLKHFLAILIVPISVQLSSIICKNVLTR